MKFSLAIIAGNVEHYLPRFLANFDPLFDEVIVVRAIGNQTPDSTLDIARDLGCITAEYHNGPDHADWPHVDNFAAARNQAWKLATGDYIAWADTDDIFNGTPEQWQQLRARIEREKPDVVSLPYEVIDDNLTVIRERIVKRDICHWVWPIHENLVLVDPDKAPRVMVVQEPRWQHLPRPGRRENDERNLRILESIPATERTLSQLFHLWQSLRALNRHEEGLVYAQQALKHPELGPEEGYELLINIAQVTNVVRTQEQYLLQALNACPHRREAFGEMVKCKLRLQDARSALCYAQMMMALPPPPEYVWNSRGKFYGYLGFQILGMALRANDRFDEADARELNHFKQCGAKISLLHATRGRPVMASNARRLWFERAANPDAVEHIFAIDGDDGDSVPLTVFRHVINTNTTGASVAAWNLAAASSAGQILIQLNDDFIPPMHWDRLILEAMSGKLNEPAVLQVSDGHRTDEQLCIALMNRARYKQQGFFLRPRFKSVYSDDYFSWAAWKDGIVIPAKHIVIEHDHPYFKNGDGWDAVYAAHNSSERYLEGERIFNELTGRTETDASSRLK